ncbi:hypothetical protein [Enterococcus larvae]|uniref:hypothetical protein n=1 Tax=Enterococcus larvae TaxID=2794352 RepID=UPI003F2AB003
MKIVIFTFIRYSHIIPVLPLLRQLCADNMVTVFCKKEYENMFEEFNCNLKFYHENYMDNYAHAEKQKEFEKRNVKLRKKISNCFYNGEETQALEKEYLKNYFAQSVLGMVNEETQSIERYSHVIDILEPDLIIRDSIEMIGLYHGKRMDVPVYSYITNNIYSLEFLKRSEEESFLGYYQLLEGNTVNVDDEKKNNLLEATMEAYSEVARILKNDSIYPAFQQAPKEKVCFICSSPKIHPEIFSEGQTQFIFLGNSAVEKTPSYTSQSEINFIERGANCRKGYLSYGSYISLPIATIVSEIRQLLTYTDRLIVSCPKFTSKEINESLFEKEKKNVHLQEGVDQEYVLANVDFFVSSGGWNSIKEAIAFEVPLIINPLFSEQILNGKMIMDLQIGVSSYHSKFILKDDSQLLEDYFKQYDIYKENIQKLNKELSLEKYPSDRIAAVLENLV